jgi:hypothetical protein
MPMRCNSAPAGAIQQPSNQLDLEGRVDALAEKWWPQGP